MGKNKGKKNEPPPEEEKGDGGKKGGKKDKKKGGGYLAQMEEEERQAKEAAQKKADLKNRFKFVKAKHILVTDEVIAKDLLEKLKAEFGTNPGPPEKDFSKFAQEYSECPSAKAKVPGQLGLFCKGQMEAPFEEAAFKTEPVQMVDELVQTKHGFHIILIEGRQ